MIVFAKGSLGLSHSHSRFLLGFCVLACILFLSRDVGASDTLSLAPLNNEQAVLAFNAGNTALREGKAKNALQFLTKALESGYLKPKYYATALHHRGIANQILGLPGPAIADYTNAISQGGLPAKTLYLAYYNRAVALKQIGNMNRAREDYKKVIEINPDYAPAHNNLANIFRIQGRHENAVTHYTLALQKGMQGQMYLAYFGRGSSWLALGEHEKAIKDLKKSLRLRPGYAPAKRELAALEQKKPRSITDTHQPSSFTNPGGQEIIMASTSNGQTRKTETGKGPSLVPDKNRANRGKPPAVPVVLFPTPGASRLSASTRLANTVTKPASPSSPSSPDESPSSFRETKKIYRVQIGAFKTPAKASVAWERSKQKYPSLLADKQPYIVETDLGERGTYYRLQLGSFPAFSDAKTFCSGLQSKGADCLVRRQK